MSRVNLLLNSYDPANKEENRERNRNMTTRADALMKQHEELFFINVGASHLPGEEGMCSMFRQKGYTVQRVFEDHHLGKVEKTEEGR